ncbi:pyroglutamyl peptidase-like protein type I [Massariosphaeria phaeospora]|uniref:Pyroglutamyl peptidase-like protein type I n=1 Tax=Massariosphaeria phaeospora TaxID=100035 RepID=A0A7C8MGI9_9PLEO|nr:pyroglutamyl peptidase-like protein type I [Massariosphaeria phaeospora]
MPRATTARQPPTKKGEDPVTVLVTGFGPFLSKYPRNSSWEIASRLPAVLPATLDSPTPIHICVHHESVRVAYSHVVNFVPRVLPPQNPMTPKPDIVLHIGLAAGRDFFALEKGSHSRGYGAIPDVDGEKFPDSTAEIRFPKSLYPSVLHTSFNTEDVLQRWKANLRSSTADAEHEKNKTPDVRLSLDAGNFLCGFIYYNSLAHYFALEDNQRPVAFLHVPDLSNSQDLLDTGREVAIALIRSLVESRRQVGVTDDASKVVMDEERADSNPRTDANFT